MDFENRTFIFVIGAPRSGTTWLHNMIAEHSDVYSLNGSNTFLHKYILPLEEEYSKEKCYFKDQGFTRGLPSKLSQTEFEKLLSDFIRRFYEVIPTDKEFYVEKATDITSKIRKIRKYLPNSKFIHIIRDGRNQTLSEVKLRNKYGPPFGVKDIYTGAVRWKQQIEEARINSSAFSSDVLEIKYEDLFTNTELNLSKIFKHIGIPFDAQTLNTICSKFNYNVNPLSTPMSSLVNSDGKPIQVYENEMSLSDKALFEYFAGDLLKSLGYSDNHLLNNKVLFAFTKFIKIPSYFLKLFISKQQVKIRRKLKWIFARIS